MYVAMQTVFSPARLVLASIGVAMVLSGSVAPAARITPERQIQTTTSAPAVPSLRAVEYERASDGLFYVTGLVNGHTVRFLVDTGASVVMLTRKDAAAVGVDIKRGAFQSRVRTANGASSMAWTTLPHIDVAGHRLSDIDAAVPQNGLPVSLLGQNVLRQLGPVTIDGDRLRVHDRTFSES